LCVAHPVPVGGCGGPAGRLPPPHRPVWAEHAATTTRVFLETRGSPDPNEHAPRRRSTEPPASSPRSTRWISPACSRFVPSRVAYCLSTPGSAMSSWAARCAATAQGTSAGPGRNVPRNRTEGAAQPAHRHHQQEPGARRTSPRAQSGTPPSGLTKTARLLRRALALAGANRLNGRKSRQSLPDPV